MRHSHVGQVSAADDASGSAGFATQSPRPDTFPGFNTGMRFTLQQKSFDKMHDLQWILSSVCFKIT